MSRSTLLAPWKRPRRHRSRRESQQRFFRPLAEQLEKRLLLANDYFPFTQAQIALTVDGQQEDVQLSGPTFVTRSDPGDSIPNGRDDSATQIHQMQLEGDSNFGPVIVTLNPNLPSTGFVEEQNNTIPDELETPANAQFNLFVLVDLPDQGIHVQNDQPIILNATLSDVPPGEGDTFNSTGQVFLSSQDRSNPLPFNITLDAVSHTPRSQGQPLPFVEHDIFSKTVGQVLLEVPDAPIVETPSSDLPPREAVYMTPADVHATYTQDELVIVLQDIRHKPFGDPIITDLGDDEMEEFDSSLEGTAVITDPTRGLFGVEVPLVLSGPVTTIVRGKGAGERTGSWDTEMISMSLTGDVSIPGGPTLPLTVEESSTQASTGRTTVLSDGGDFRIDSFFDIFTDLSIDGGQPIPSAEATRVQAFPNGIQSDKPTLPPTAGEYRSAADVHASFFSAATQSTMQIVLQDVRHRGFVLLDRGIDGADEVETFQSELFAVATINGEFSRGPITVPIKLTGPVKTRVSDKAGQTTGTFQTEILSMDLSGIVDLPGQGKTILSIREDAELDSGGATTIRNLPDGTFHIDSFFDVFTELSIDGGRTWSPATDSAPVHLHEEPERVLVSGIGEAKVDVYFDGPNEGDAGDHDHDGTDDVLSQVVDMRLNGYIEDVGSFQIAARPDEAFPSLGRIEEQENRTTNLLDVKSTFATEGVADSFFDVWPQITVQINGQYQSFFTAGPTRVESVIQNKKPISGERYVFAPPQPVPLLTAAGDVTQFRIVREVHDTTIIEHDALEETTALLKLVGGPIGDTPQAFTVSGPADIDVFFEGPAEGIAFDDDFNGLDEVETELVSMNLTDGDITVRIRPENNTPYNPSLGRIEEKVNNNFGELDLDPFHAGTASSHFNVFFEIELADGTVLHNQTGLRLEADISEKPPFDRYVHIVPPNGPLELYVQTGQFSVAPSGIFLVAGEHTIGKIEHDVFNNTVGQILVEATPFTNAPLVVSSGSDLLATPADGQSFIMVDGIPEGFFGEVNGALSDAVVSPVRVNLKGVPGHVTHARVDSLVLGDATHIANESNHLVTEVFKPSEADTVVRRKQDVVLNDIGDIATVPIEIVALSLTSLEPIQVTYGGSNPQFFDVFVDLDEGTQREGQGMFTRTRADGGTLDSALPVNFEATFTNTDPAGPTAAGTVQDAFDFTLDDGGFRVRPSTITGNPTLPPTDGVYRSPDGVHAEFQGNDLAIVLMDVRHRAFGPAQQRTIGLDRNEVEVFDSGLTGTALITSASLGLDNVPVAIELEGPVTTVVRGKGGQATGTWDTEILSMDLRGSVDTPGGLPIEIAIRESSELASEGQTTITTLRRGEFNVDSFFDIHTEISIDGGRTWTPSVDSTVVELAPPPVIVSAVGPTEVIVFFEGDTEGDARDDDGDGLEEVDTVITRMDMRGSSPWGPVEVRLDPSRQSRGTIEEASNGTPGTLDVAPFSRVPTGAGTSAHSTFDVWPEIVVGGQVLHPQTSLHLEENILHKPPKDGERYQNPFQVRVPLLDEQGNPTGIYVLREIHQPDGPIEVDIFEQTTALVQLVGDPIGSTAQAFVLRGPSEAHVFFEGANEGDAEDDDGDGLDEVPTQLVSMDLTDGTVTLRVRDIVASPFGASMGQIEEKRNNNPGRLDLDPFHDGDANSYFDVFFEIQVGTDIFHNETPLRIESMIGEKPPTGGRYVHLKPLGGLLELYDENDQPTGVFVVSAEHNTGRVEIDKFENTRAIVALDIPGIGEVSGVLRGPSEVHVLFEGNTEGDADDDDGNGREEVATRMAEFELTGNLPGVGQVIMRLNPDIDSLGKIEEHSNLVSGTLDVAPFTHGGLADSFFDIFFEVEIPGLGMTLHNRVPQRVQTVIAHKPPDNGEQYIKTGGSIQLFDENGEVQATLVKAIHQPAGHFVEHDHFEETVAQIELIGPTGSETIRLTGPTWVDVWFETREGEALDDSDALGVSGANGLDEVMTKMIQLDLTGISSMGPVTVRLNPDPAFATTGVIEEKVNRTPGILDLPPFTDVGSANSFFDIFMEIELPDGTVLHNEQAKRISSMITEKPPEPGAVYESPTTIPLLLADGSTSEFSLGPANHIPRGHFIERDEFEETFAEIELIAPNGTVELVQLIGPTVVDVWFERNEGEALDNDTPPDGLEEVMTRMVELDLRGNSSMGPVRVTLNPDVPTTGLIEEVTNNTPGLLDVRPFADFGAAVSTFDVFFNIEVGGHVLHNVDPKVLRSIIHHKPPGPGDVYENLNTIALFNENNVDSGFAIGASRHVPNGHFIEHDHFEETEAEISLNRPDGTSETISLVGPTWIDVWFERREGEARDDDGDGLDEVMTRVVGLDLQGTSSAGPVIVGLNPAIPSTGEIEETVNRVPGVLDLPPFGTGTARSTFDMWLVVQVNTPDGVVELIAEEAKHMSSLIRHKPPGPGDVYENPDTIRLLWPDGTPSGYSLGPGKHVPQPHFIEKDHFEDTVAQITLEDHTDPDNVVSETIEVRGPTWVDVWFERREGEALDDGGVAGLEEVMTRMQQLDLKGTSATFGQVNVRLNPAFESTGQIEERVNNTPGVLDVAPFAATGVADSFFDVFVEIEIPGQGITLHNIGPKVLRSTIDHKPPGPGTVYESPESISLYDEDGEQTNFVLGATRHIPNGHFVEHDHFHETFAEVELIHDSGNSEVVQLAGPTWVDVWFEVREGEALDDDGDGFDEVMTEMIQLDLRGDSSFGPVHVGLNPAVKSTGEIEERANNTPGVLDLQPFTSVGAANSVFDLWLAVTVLDPNGEPVTLMAEDSKHLQSIIHHKPPGPGDVYESPETIRLLLPDGTPSEFQLGAGRHVPNGHFIEHDHFEETTAVIDLVAPDGSAETITLHGPTWVDVWFERLEGHARDDVDDNEDPGQNGLDEVMTRMQQLDLWGNSSMGPVHVTLNPQYQTTGQIEERINNTPGVLDVAPFTSTGVADSFFDVFVQIEVGGRTLHNEQAKRISSRIDHKPPGTGTVYESPTTISLFDEAGNDTGFLLGATRHIPRDHFVEHDHFEETVAQVTIEDTATGQSETIELRGPTWIDVWFENREGQALDDDGNGLEEVMTHMRHVELRGDSNTFGPVLVHLNPDIDSTGIIEERENNTPGVLDVAPFTSIGVADSFFDVFVEIEIPRLDVTLHNIDPKVLKSVIEHKPPQPGAVYESPETIPLYDEAGNLTTFVLGSTRHIPNGHFIEHDHFEETYAEITLNLPDGGSETVQLTGPTWVDVWFETREGEARDGDGNGLDDVMTKMTGLDLRGSSSLGPVHVGLNPAVMSTGTIEELVNNTPGILDVAPFAPGEAKSDFDLWLVVTVVNPATGGPIQLIAEEAKVMSSIIKHKPPGPGDEYESPTTIKLLLPDGSDSGFSLGPGRHVPNGHFVEHDHFEETTAVIDLINPQGQTETITLHGPTWVDVWFESKEGEAKDDDATPNGREEVMTHMRQLDLHGDSSMGPVHVRLNPRYKTTGVIEETNNTTPGILDVAPFADGTADSFFDVFVEIRVGDRVLHNNDPKRISAQIDHKPPGVGTIYESPTEIDLFDENDNATGFKLGATRHIPQDHFIEHDHFEETVASVTLEDAAAGLSETIELRGPTWIDVWFESQEGHAQDDTTGNAEAGANGLEEVMTKMLQLDLKGESDAFGPISVRLNPQFESTGIIEEQVNNTPGILDVAPFAATGAADSFFDVFVEIEIPRLGVTLHNLEPKVLQTVINHKPPEPGATYESPDVIPLFDAAGNQTTFTLGATSHTPADHFVEYDHFEETVAEVTLINLTDPTHPAEETIRLGGPAWIEVWFETDEGEAEDDDNDGLDEVMTKMTRLDLRGNSSLGPIHVGLNPAKESVGEIEETANNTPGRLDLDPFHPGTADSFFDVWLVVTVPGPDGQPLRLVAEAPKHMQSLISHKPPTVGDVYESPQTIRLLLPDGTPSNFALGPGRHAPEPPVEVDFLESTTALVQLQGGPLGAAPVPFILSGSSEVHVFFEGFEEGDANDDDNDGLEEVITELIALNLTDGNVTLRIRDIAKSPFAQSLGEIEEQANNTAGVLDIDPFAPGFADSFFDVLFEIELADGTILHNGQPLRIQSVISEKPPFRRYIHIIPPGGAIELLNENDQGSSVFIVRAEHRTGKTEIDVLQNTQALIQIEDPAGNITTHILSGDAEAHVFFEGPNEGDAKDDDGDGLDEVGAELFRLNLTDGNVTLLENPLRPSFGGMTEQTNGQPGTLDVAPFGSGAVDSFFDVFFRLDVGGLLLHNEEALALEATIFEKPPFRRYVHIVPAGGALQLFDAAGDPTGFKIVRAEHRTGIVEVDVLEETQALVQIATNAAGDGAQSFILNGSAVAHVLFEGPNEGDAKDDDGDGLDEVQTELVSLNLTHASGLQLTENSRRPSLGGMTEQTNSQPGTLDVAPFGRGAVDSFFDVFFELNVPGVGLLHNGQALTIQTVIHEKPPFRRYIHIIPPGGAIELLDENDDPSGVFIVRAEHRTGKTEIDVLQNTQALVQIEDPAGNVSTHILTGDAEAHVFFEGPNEGDATDDDGDGLDEVDTELFRLNLTDGNVTLLENPLRPSFGGMTEQNNGQSGTLDVSPFGNGAVDSFFDVFFRLDVGGLLLHNEQALTLEATIFEKPPFRRYVHLIPPNGALELFDAAGDPTGFKIVRAEHRTGKVEVDVMEDTLATVTLVDLASGGEEEIQLRGPTTVHVFFEGTDEGDAKDDDNDGLDEVETEIVSLDLTGTSSLGDIRVRNRTDVLSLGEIEEKANNSSGLLDIDPFADGDADSFFDVFFEIEVGGRKLITAKPKRMRTVITEKPPGEGDTYFDPGVVELLDANTLEPTGLGIGSARHTPRPFVEHDVIEETTGLVQLVGGPLGATPVPFILRGSSEVDVFFEGREGDAFDNDGNGLEEVRTELVQLDLTDGNITLSLNPNQGSLGQIEELLNNTPHVLDLDPFADGDADSFFDVLFQIDVGGGMVVHNAEPLRIEAKISEKPPIARYFHIIPPNGPIELLDANDDPSGVFIVAAEHYTGHVEVDEFENTLAEIELIDPNGGSELIRLHGPSTVHVFFERAEGAAHDDDEDGLGEVQTEIVSMNLTGTSSLGPVEVRLNPQIRSTGEIEERANNTTGVLDLDPFAAGDADSFFDVFFEIQIGDQVFVTNQPKHMASVIKEKPPAPGDAYEAPETIPLLTRDGFPTGFALGATRHIPRPVAPEPNDDNYMVRRGGTLTVTDPTAGVLANDSDPNGDSLKAVVVDAPVHATSFSLSDDGTFTYVHDGSTAKSDTFTYDADDGNGNLVRATATIVIKFVEIDQMEETTGLIQLVGGPIGSVPVPFILRGSSTAHVFFEGPNEGDAQDNNDNSREEVQTELVSLNLTDGNITLSLNPNQSSLGEIEELVNNTAGTLDLDPFADGDADSFFDVFFQIDVGGGVMVHNAQPLRIEATISEKPPIARYFHVIPPADPIELLTANDDPSGVFIVEAEHYTGHVEVDQFDDTLAEIELIDPSGGSELIRLEGPSTVHVFFERDEGAAHDDDGNRLDEVQTEMISLSLTGTSSLGPVEVRLNPRMPTTGRIEELRNNTAGVLDLNPFASGAALSLFDVFFEIEVGGQVLHNQVPKQMSTIIREKPPEPGAVYEDPERIALLNTDGEDTGFALGATRHTPNPDNRPPIADDDNYTVRRGGTLQATDALGVLANDSSPTSDPLTVGQVIDAPTHAASFSLNSDGSFTYVHDGSRAKTDVFTYVANDGSADSNTATVTISILAVEVDVFETTTAQLLLELPTEPNIVTSNPNLPPTDGEYRTAAQVHSTYQGDDLVVVLQDIRHRAFADPRPQIEKTGRDEQESFQSSLTGTAIVTSASLGLDAVPVPVELSGPVQTIVRDKAEKTTGRFDTEIVSMTLTGNAALPNGETLPLTIQASPSQESLGQVTIMDLGDGQFRIDSFFDVFTELSIDGGQNFIPATNSTRVELSPPPQLVTLIGPTTVNVFFEGQDEGDAKDDDGDNLDEVQTEIVSLQLTGRTPQGRIDATLRNDRRSLGEIEERQQVVEGTLDVDPFTQNAVADSFFDVWTEITIGGRVLHTAGPLRLETSIENKPPNSGERYVNPFLVRVELIDPATGQGTGIFVLREIHQPAPTTEVDVIEQTTALISLRGGLVGSNSSHLLRGSSELHVFFEGPNEGHAVDDSGNGLEEVISQLVSLNLTDGEVTLRIRNIAKSPFSPSLGQIEEKANDTTGVLDLDPFATGDANSFFDVFFEIELADGTILHNGLPLRIEAMISEKPPVVRFIQAARPQDGIELLNADDEPTATTLFLSGLRSWQNPINRLDANGDGTVAPIDVLVGINELAQRQFIDENGRLPDAADMAEFPFLFFDANGDGFLSPVDPLQIINFLSDAANPEAENSIGAVEPGGASLFAPLFVDLNSFGTSNVGGSEPAASKTNSAAMSSHDVLELARPLLFDANRNVSDSVVTRAAATDAALMDLNLLDLLLDGLASELDDVLNPDRNHN